MAVPAAARTPPPPWLEALRARASKPSINVAAPFDPNHAIGLIAAPWVLSQTLDYLSGYYVPSAVPHAHILDVATAGAEVRAWADEARLGATPIAGTRLAIASGLSGDVAWHVRFEEAAFADLTVFLADRTVILTSHDGVIPPHLGLARLVRNRLSSDWSLAGGAYLHAGCVTIGGVGVVILGDKFAGKTTQICELVSRGARFTSNDRIFLFPNGRVVGLPVSVNIRPGTLERYDSLRAWRSAGLPNPHRVGMNVPDSDVSLSVAQFADAFRATISPTAPLHAVVRLTRSGAASTQSADMEGSKLVDLLASSLFDGIDYSQPFWPYRRSDTRTVAQIVETHAKVACEIDIGEGDIGACARLIEDLLTDRARAMRG
ncbi:MAG: hypothetical protein JOZ90_15035 [Alphaproteobacteria bacterium]|nr:hypothetical protein [Alphaproteobacteria bacterium]MBV9371451.1 hypothetical protein [Alphaproteobacteria bacterium]MBV9902388.1 hypothetical protein [Alphaproteobacteria bacterium]